MQHMHTQALGLVRMSLMHMVDPSYESQVEQFVEGPYPLAIEAARLLGLAAMIIQPESRRRYARFADPIVTTKPGRFPTVFRALARPNALKKTPLPLSRVDLQEHVEHAEHLLYAMHQAIVRNIDLLDQWSEQVDEDSSDDRRSRREMTLKLEQCTQQLLNEASIAP